MPLSKQKDDSITERMKAEQRERERAPNEIGFTVTLDLKLTAKQWRAFQEVHALTGYATMERTTLLALDHLARHYGRRFPGDE